MGQEEQASVRSHGEEREWLLALGNGDLVEGVKQLALQLKSEATPKKPGRLRPQRSHK